MTAFQIGLRAIRAATSAEDMAQSVTHVGQHLNEICVNTPNLIAFTLEADRPARTVRFTLYVEETAPGAYGWQMAVRPERRERIPA